MICLIPARKGSKRIPGKNTKRLAGYPLITYTIAAAIDSGVFKQIVVCSDDTAALDLAKRMGVGRFKRSNVADGQPDIEWVKEVLAHETRHGWRPWSFCILRPTSPFRTAETILRAKWRFDSDCLNADSLRAVEPVSQHPGKMWTWEGIGYAIKPVLDQRRTDGTPWHSSPSQGLPTYYVQNASLEMAWTANVEVQGSIAGRSVMPFFTEGYEGFDLNEPRDWREAEYLIASGAAVLPAVPLAPVPSASPAV
jgi:CMP-N,N'-diacetyllegionaminic acid synthase